MVQYLFVVMVAFCLVGCSASNDVCTKPVCYQKTKPNIAFIPVKESVACNYNWDLSKELTDETLTALMEKNSLYVTPYLQFKNALDSTKECDYFSSDLNFANYFGNSDFLIVTELLKHETVPFNPAKNVEVTDGRKNYAQFQVLNMETRVRVLDLRFEHPKVILQKFIDSREIVSGSETKIDYSVLTPESDLFEKTPLYRGHNKMALQLAKEIENAIVCNW